MIRRQRGVTFIGWLILLIPVAIVGYVAIRLVPIYLNYMRVAHSVEQTAIEMKTDEVATLTPVAHPCDAGQAFRHREHHFPGREGCHR